MTTTDNIYVNVFLTNLGKYTEGYLIGKWITLSKLDRRTRKHRR